MIDPKNRNYITSAEYIDSVGETIPSMLLVSGVNILYNWCQYKNLDGDIVIGKIEIAYANDDIMLE